MSNSSPVVGIDLGTTFSAIAFVNPETGKAEVITSPEQERITPSVVLFEDADTVMVGKLAKQSAIADPEKVVEFVKREMGKPKDDTQDFTGWNRTFSGRKYGAQEVSALILKKLKLDAEARLGKTLSNAVITCPAYFGDNERAATREAGVIAGFNVLGILDEPVAAALAYGLDKLDRDQRIFVFDLGGGTFDVAILEIKNRSVREIAVNGDHRLGGKDWDDVLINHVARLFSDKYGTNPLADNSSYQDLQMRAIAVKESLSRLGSAKLVCNHAGNSLLSQITKVEFEVLTRPLVEKCQTLCEIMMGEAKLDWDSIDTVLLVGGSTRMPMIREMVHKLTGKQPSDELNPDECVAQGAAWQGLLLATSEGISQEGSQKWIPSGLTVQKVTSHNLGTEVHWDSYGKTRNTLMIPKFTAVPCEITKTFHTRFPNQESVSISVMEGGEMGPDDTCDMGESTKIAEAPITEIPPSPQGSPVEITYKYDNDGIIHAVGKHVPSGRFCRIVITRPGGLSQGEREAAVKQIAKFTVTS